MQVINSRQDWLEWRKGGIGASDAYILMELGGKGWATPSQILEQKIAEKTEEWEGNYITKLGDESEPKIRSLFELMQGQSFDPCLVQSDKFAYVRASLDGRSEDKTEIAEIKLLNKADWDLANKEKKVPEKYYCQIQHQFIASQAKKCWFVAYLFQEYKLNRRKPLDAGNMAIVEVLPDKEYQAKILAKETDFWINHVMKRKPLAIGKDELLVMEDVSQKAKWFLEVKEKHDELTKILGLAEEDLRSEAEGSGHTKVEIGGIKFVQVVRAGSFSSAKVPEVAEFTEKIKLRIKEFVDKMSAEDKLKYTGKGSTYWKMTLPKAEPEKSEKKETKKKVTKKAAKKK